MEQLLMKWNKGEIPDFKLPEGYELVQYRRGGTERLSEEEFRKEWIGIRMSDGNLEQMEKWFHTVYDDPDVPEDGFFVILYNGKIVSNAQIQLGNHEPGTATLHAVCTDPAHRGKGLGKIITGAVMKNALDRGLSTVYLTTDDFRIPAIRAYLKMEFLPVIFSEDQRTRWKKIFEELQIKEHAVFQEDGKIAVLKAENISM